MMGGFGLKFQKNKKKIKKRSYFFSIRTKIHFCIIIQEEKQQTQV